MQHSAFVYLNMPAISGHLQPSSICSRLLKACYQGSNIHSRVNKEAHLQSLLSQGAQNLGVCKFLHSRRSNERFRPKFSAEITAAFQVHQALGKILAQSTRANPKIIVWKQPAIKRACAFLPQRTEYSTFFYAKSPAPLFCTPQRSEVVRRTLCAKMISVSTMSNRQIWSVLAVEIHCENQAAQQLRMICCLLSGETHNRCEMI